MIKKITKKKQVVYITAYDPIAKKRVVYVIKDKWAVSLVTKHKFKYNGEK
jgi:hypothetical protein